MKLCRQHRAVVVIAAAVLAAAMAGHAQLAVTAVSVERTRPFPPSSGGGYSNIQVVVDDAVERRLYRNDHHFATIVDQNGTLNIRPHPGVDRNGWGSSLYLQPFLNDPDVLLKHTSFNSINASSTGILINVSGMVSTRTNSTYGAWSITNLSFTYDPATKIVQATGTYAIVLDGLLSATNRDLNLYRLASNYLLDVPLLDGTTNDTGDMTHVVIVRNQAATNTWNPRDGDSFPTDQADSLSMEAVGDYYEVDTLAQTWTNFSAIQAAYKPSVRVELTAHEAGYPLIAGCQYDEARSNLYYADNVGITPVILSTAPFTQFVYSVAVVSSALAGDGQGVGAFLAAGHSGTNPPGTTDVYFLPTFEESLRRFVGTLSTVDSNKYEGPVEVPLAPGTSPDKGFFRLKVP